MAIPDDFGKPGGTEVANGVGILKEVDRRLGTARVSYLLARPAVNFRIPFLGLGLNFNSYGHSVVRFRLDDGRDMVMNIEGKREGKNMVKFYNTADYMFGLKEHNTASQGGMYHRSFVEVRLNNTTNEEAMRVFNYYKWLQESYDMGRARFNIFFGPVYNMARNVFPSLTETGNCARWCSKGMKEAGIINSVSMWPKSIAIDLFENGKRDKNGNGVTVVLYERIPHCAHWYGQDGKCVEVVAPLQPFRQLAYGNFQNAANLRVYVPTTGITAEIEECDPVMKPSKIRNVVNSTPAITISVIGFAYYGWRFARRRIFKR